MLSQQEEEKNFFSEISLGPVGTQPDTVLKS